MKTVKVSARQLSRLVRESLTMDSPQVLIQHAIDELDSASLKIEDLNSSAIDMSVAVEEALQDIERAIQMAVGHLHDASPRIRA